MSASGLGGTGALIAAVVLAAIPTVYVVLAMEPVPAIVAPVLIAAFPLAFRKQAHARLARLVALLLLAAFIFAGILSVGIFFVPSAVAMVIAAIRASTPPADQPG